MRAVYLTLESVLAILNSTECAEVSELLSIWNCCNKYSNAAERANPFIVLEGLDGSGKTTIGKMLAKRMNGVLRVTPPPSISKLREYFDSCSEEMKRAYYSLGNYIVAEEIQHLLRTSPVILDRFWHSSAAYGMTWESNLNGALLPAENDLIYEWPKDLLKPDFVFFLQVSEDIRNERLSRRKHMTIEEEQLKKQKEFRAMLVDSYMRMKNPSVHIVNSDLPKYKVLQEMVKIMVLSGKIQQNTFRKS